ISDYVASSSNINYIFSKDAMMDKKRYYRVYRKYDTHYNNAGAYLTHNEILKKDNKEYIDIDDLKIDKVECKNKDLVWMSGQNDLNYMDDFDYDIHYREDIEVKQVHEDHDNSGDVNRWIDIYESSVNNEELLLFYGDSFKENIKQFLSKDYKKTVFMGTRIRRKNEMLENSVEAAKVIVIENAGRNEEVMLDAMIKEVTRILKKLPDVKNIE
ncbi:MAG: hypothetical protein MJ151_03260, partial [Lachnospiraceae bacterium]|nr:hypothetical protein [Lachnospiraceae bacterium]